jgi:hypothetical protein
LPRSGAMPAALGWWPTRTWTATSRPGSPAREPAIRRQCARPSLSACRSSGRTRWPARISGANQDYADYRSSVTQQH